MSPECTTPGLFYDKPESQNFGEEEENIPDTGNSKSQSNFIEINKILQKIHYYQKKEKSDDWKEWLDKRSNEELFLKLLDLY